MTPLPGTELWTDLDARGKIITKDWSKFSSYQHHKTFEHPNLDWDTIYKYYSKFYRDFYLRPSYIFKRFIYDLKNRTLMRTFRTFLAYEWYELPNHFRRNAK